VTPVPALRLGLHVVVDSHGNAVLRTAGGERRPLVEVRHHPRLLRYLAERLGLWLRAASGRWADTDPVVRAVRWACELMTDWLAWLVATAAGG
jgi:hypothetical protein